MANQLFDLEKLYHKTFGTKPYNISSEDNISDKFIELFNINGASTKNQFTPKGSLLMEQVNGIDIWLPVRFYDGSNLLMHLPYTVVKIETSKNIIETSLKERKGTVKELFNFDDYSISVKGFLIGEDRQFPEAQLQQLKELSDRNMPVILDNALTNIFLTDPTLGAFEQRRVAIYDLDFAEVSGGRIHVRPFSMKLKSDAVFILELDNL